MKCNQCSMENVEGSKYCFQCGGSLIQNEADYENSHEENNKKEAVKTKKNYIKIISIASIVVIMLIGVGIYYNYNQNIKKYESNLNNAMTQILIETYLCSNMCNTISEKWKSAISDGYNFNNAIKKQIESWTNDNTIKKRKEKSDKLEVMMKELKNPKSDYKESYDLLVELYSLYGRIYEQAIQPTGSIITYNSDVNSKLSEFNKVYDKIKVIKPEIEGQVKDKVKNEI